MNMRRFLELYTEDVVKVHYERKGATGHTRVVLGMGLVITAARWAREQCWKGEGTWRPPLQQPISLVVDRACRPCLPHGVCLSC